MIELEDRIRGAVIGLAVGDALGAPVEFMGADAIEQTHGRVTEMMRGGLWLAGEWTDDTSLTIAAAQAYRSAGFELDQAAQAMVAWMRTGPKDIGNLTGAALRLIDQGKADARTAGRQALLERPGNAGNGSLMRALPTGLVRCVDDPRLVTESIEISAITHADARCLSCCVAFNLMIAAMLEGRAAREAVTLAAGHAAVDDSQVKKILAEVLAGESTRFSNSDGIGYVLLCFEWSVRTLLDAVSFEEGVVDVVNRGGDTDTNGAVTGALLGVCHGIEAIPIRWSEALRAQEPVKATADLLLERVS